MSDCVFCRPGTQPPRLFESASFYVIPDRFPLRPGHLLVISKEHRRCHAAGPVEGEEELEAVAARAEAFLRDAYGCPALAWENGVFGQTVFHAHLHLLPVAAEGVPAE